MVRDIIKSESLGYLKQSEEFLNAALLSMDKGLFNAAGFNAIQAIINANDALTVYYLEKRASKDHKEAVRLHIDVIRKTNDSSGRDALKQALDQRSLVGYTAKPISRENAERHVKSAAKFVDWAKRHVV